MDRLREAEAKTPITNSRRTCTFAIIRAQLTEQELATLEHQLNDPNMGHARLTAILHKAGFKVGESSVKRHRAGGCQRCLPTD